MEGERMPDIANLTTLLLYAALPVVIILIAVYLKDKNKEPLSLLIMLFLGGFMSCVLVLLASDIMGTFLPFMNGTVATKSFINIILYAFIGVALVEEVCKWIMVYIIGYRNSEYDELYDGIVYCIFVSLGFAFIENILYVINTTSIKTAILRAVTAVPSHAFDAVFMGYYLSLAKKGNLKKNKELEKKNLILSIIVPTLLHGIYDFCLMSGYQILTIVFLVFVVYLYVISIRKIKLMSRNNKKIKFKNNFCSNCGKAVTGEFCSNCGKKQE